MNQIPKIIHYCWFGQSEMSDSELLCIDSWKKYMPEYKLYFWNEMNSPMNHPYMKNAYKKQKWANMSNFVRLYALEKYGGWYFDTDVEVIKKPDLSNFEELCFLCLETKEKINPFVVNNAVISCIPGHTFIKNCLSRFESDYDGTEKANISSPVMTTEELIKLNFKGKPGVYDTIRVLPNSYFYPGSFFDDNKKLYVKEETITIHHYSASWISKDEISNDEYISLLKNYFRYKTKFRDYQSGNIDFIELVKLNSKYLFKSLFRIKNKFLRNV